MNELFLYLLRAKFGITIYIVFTALCVTEIPVA